MSVIEKMERIHLWESGKFVKHSWISNVLLGKFVRWCICIYIERERREIKLREILANDFYKVLELIKNWNETLSFKERCRRIITILIYDRNDIKNILNLKMKVYLKFLRTILLKKSNSKIVQIRSFFNISTRGTQRKLRIA